VAAAVGKDETLVAPFTSLAKRPVINDELGYVPVVFLYEKGVVSPLDAGAIAESRDVGTVAVLDRRLGRRTLRFVRRGEAFVDEQTGSTWDLTGRAVAGRLKGERLRPVRHDEQFWFALAAFVPDPRFVGEP